MMNDIELWVLAVALAMDCFTVSIVSGVILQRRIWGVILRISFLFGLFQAMMPLIGWFGISHFTEQIEAYDHWIAFALLVFLGINMIREAFSKEEEHQFNPTLLLTQLTLAVATSIDALAVGVSLSCMGYKRISDLTAPLVIIGMVSFFFGLLGHELGIRLGHAIRRRLKPELLGGLILIAIGIKILSEHLLE